MPHNTSQSTAFPSPQDFFLRVSSYAPYKFTESNYTDVLRVEFYMETFDAYCVECQRESVFTCDGQQALVGGAAMARPPANTEEIANANSISLVNRHRMYNSDPGFIITDAKQYAFKNRAFEVRATCSRDKTHEVVFYFKVLKGEVMKIGQFPSIADFEEQEVRKYHKVLGDEYYRELSRAVGLNAHGVGIGAFVYLRRIFEDLIETAHKQAASDSKWDESAFAAGRMDEKIGMLRAQLPPFLYDNRSIYSILSLGIHSLTEEQCLQHFPTMLVGIELILDQKMQAEEMQKKVGSVSKAINAIKGALSKGA